MGGGVEKHWDRIGDFSRFVRYEVGDGLKIMFWHIVWYGDQTVKEAFSM
jgi:hypothetical protein